MDRENTADVGSSIIKLGLAVGAIMNPHAGVVSAGIDVVLSAIKSLGLLKEKSTDSIDGQLRDCISNVFMRIQNRQLTDTYKKWVEDYIIPHFELWLGTEMPDTLLIGDIDSMFLEWSNCKDARRELYITEQDICKINELFINLFKDELLSHPMLADWYGINQIASLERDFLSLSDEIMGKLDSIEKRIAILERPINPQIDAIIRRNPREQIWSASRHTYKIGKRDGHRFAYDIIERLLPSGYVPKLIMPIDGKAEEGEDLPLIELCNATNEHTAIIGNGGTGKTTFLQFVMSEIFSHNSEWVPDLQIPIFVELNRCPADLERWYDESLRKTNFITRYIGSMLENHSSLHSVNPLVLDYVEKELQKRPESGEPQYLLLLDGFNEVKIDEGYNIRNMLSNEISVICNYANVRIITTSRETQAAFYAADFYNIRISGLKKDEINTHLRRCNKPEHFIGEVNNNKRLMECLRVPLYLCMFASNDQDTLLPETQGEILYFFFHRNSTFYNIRKRATETRTNPLNDFQTKLILDFILPYVGFCFERDDVFFVSKRTFEQLIEESIDSIRAIFLTLDYIPYADFNYSTSCLQSAVDSLFEKGILKTAKIIECVFDYFGIVYQYQVSKGHHAERLRYAFCHHSFRDYFSAIWNIQILRIIPESSLQIKIGNETSAFSSALNSHFWSLDKVGLISEILMEHRNKPYFDEMSGNWYIPEPEYDEQSVLSSTLDACRELGGETDIHYLLENILSSIRYGRGELTLVDLHGLDLSQTNFFNVICSRKGRNTTSGTDFSNSTLVEDCFFPQNHQDSIIEYVYYGKKCITIDDAGLIKFWDCISGKFEYEIKSGDPVGNRDTSSKGYIKISGDSNWLGVKVQESLSNGMSIKLHIFNLKEPHKPPVCLIPRGNHSVLSFFAFSDNSDSVAIICDKRYVYCFGLDGELLYQYVLHECYSNNELYLANTHTIGYIFSHEFDPFENESFDPDDNGIYDAGNEEYFDDVTEVYGVPCAIWKWDIVTGEMTELYHFFGAADTHPTIAFLSGMDSFLLYNGETKQIEVFNCQTEVRKNVFISVTSKNQDPPAAFHCYTNKPSMCLIMYSENCYRANLESEFKGIRVDPEYFPIAGIEKKLKEKGLITELYFSTNVAPSNNRFLVFDDDGKTYEWDLENDTVRSKYNGAFYDTAYLAVDAARTNAYLIHGSNGISQFSQKPVELVYQYCYQEQDYSVNIGASDEINNRIALAFASLGHEKVILIDLDIYSERTIFSTVKQSETVVDLSFNHDGTKVLITTQYKCVEYDLASKQELIIAEAIGAERFAYGNYTKDQLEITIVEGTEDGLPTRCEFYSRKKSNQETAFVMEWYYIVPELPYELFEYFIYANGDFGKEGLHGEDGIQKYRITRGFFLENRPEFVSLMAPECYKKHGDSFIPATVRFDRLETICVRHVKDLHSRRSENRVTAMYYNSDNNEAIFARNNADLAWVRDFRNATYKEIEEIFDRHLGNDRGYCSWNYVIPWRDNKILGCFETFQIALIDSASGEQAAPIKYSPGLSITGCNFSSIHANEEVRELIQNTGGRVLSDTVAY